MADDGGFTRVDDTGGFKPLATKPPADTGGFTPVQATAPTMAGPEATSAKPQGMQLLTTPEGRANLWSAIKQEPGRIIEGMIETTKRPGQALKTTPQQPMTTEEAVGPATEMAMLGGVKMGRGMRAPAPAGEPVDRPIAPKPGAAPSIDIKFTGAGKPESGVEPTAKPPAKPPAPSPETPTPTPQFVQAQADSLFKLRQTITADKQEIAQRLDTMPPEFKTAEMQERFYDALEDPKLLEPDPKSNTHLNAQEKAIFDQHIKPMQDELGQLYSKTQEAGYPTTNEGYVHRVRKGHEPVASPLEGGHSDVPQMGTRSLPRSTSALQHRTFYALEDAQTGHRAVVSSGGKDAMTVWNKGKQTTGQVGDEIKPGNVVTVGGKTYNVVQATTKEIEANTPVRYQKSAAVNMADALVRMRAVVRNIEHLENLTKTPEWNLIATKDKMNTPRGWIPTKLPQLEGWRMDPKMAHVFNDFYKPGLGDAALLEGLRKVNRFAVGSLFWQPTPHIENVAGHWFVGRGWENVTPYGLRSLFTNGSRAIKEVSTQGKDYQSLLKNGSGLIYGGVANADFYMAMAKKFGMEMERDPARWGPIAQKLGFNKVADMTAAYYKAMNKVLWWANDVFMLQRVFELEGRGLSRAEAIKEAEKHIPNYRIPSQVMGSRMFSEVMQDPAVTSFGRYHYGVWNSYSNMVSDLVKGSKKERIEAVGNMMALGLLAYGVYPIVDYGLHKLTGNEDIRKLRRGPAAIPDAVYKLLGPKEKSMTDIIGNSITLSPVFKEGIQQLSNRDLFTGKNISEPAEERKTKFGKVLAQKGEHLAGALVAPYALLQKQQKDADEKGIPRQMADQIIGLEDRTKKSKTKQKRAFRFQERAAKKRKPAGLIEKGEQMLEKTFGGPQE